jgi:hypothetical protein
MRAVTAGAALLAALVLAGCGGADDRRHAVDGYISSVNRAQVDASAGWGRATKAYRLIGRSKLSPKDLAALDSAARTVRKVRRRIAALDPPPDAHVLHASLLKLLDREAGFATEVARFGHFLNDVAPISAGIQSDTATMRKALKKHPASAPAEQALARYERQLGKLRARLAKLKAPAALAPWQAEQTRRLAALRKSAGELRRGVAERSDALVAQGLEDFRAAASRPATTKADRDAIVAYNARLKRISALSAKVAAAQQKLADELR